MSRRVTVNPGRALEALTGLVDEHRAPLDALVHLAAIPAPGLVPNAATFANNAPATWHVFSAARAARVRNVLWASSETVLGLPSTRPRRTCPSTRTTGCGRSRRTRWSRPWSAETSAVSLAFLFQAVNLLAGVAFGLLLLSSALAIVLFFVVPLAFTIVTSLVGALREPATWVDLSRSLEPVLTGDMTGTAWAKLATSATVWILLPLAAGTVRLLRREVA